MAAGDSHWVRWHQSYDDPSSGLSARLRVVQSMVSQALDDLTSATSAPGRVLSLCAGQGRDVIDVLAERPDSRDVRALLVESDPTLVAFARARIDGAQLTDRVRVIQGDAARCAWYAADVPADLVLLCGIFGNITARDITATIDAMRGFCRRGAHVVWTRHRLPPDATPSIRAEFAAAGFTELDFVAPEGTVNGVGHHRFDGTPTPFDPERVLFEFVGDGSAPR